MSAMSPDMGTLSAPEEITPALEQRAVIHIGANAMSMILVQGDGSQGAEVEVLEYLEQPLPLAEDIFRDGVLSRSTIERSVRIAERFGKTLTEYAIPARNVQTLVMNILSEADNREALLNRLQVACGLSARSLDEGDMTRLVYLLATNALRSHARLKKGRVLAVHVGPGNTRLMLFNKGRIQHYTSYRMGAHRVAEAVERLPSDSLIDLIQGHVNGNMELIEKLYSESEITEILAIGHEIQQLAPQVETSRPLTVVDRRKLRKFTKRLATMSGKEISSLLDINAYAADAIVAGAVCNMSIADRLHVKQLAVPQGRFEEGFLTALALGEIDAERFILEVIHSARALGKKCRYDSKHSLHVAALSVRLFDELVDMIGLSSQDRLLLEVAAILHEVGSFISRRSHHKHSLYIIKNSEIFGLNEEETLMVALVARYHRHSLPQPHHPHMNELPRAVRVRVSKLAALLRVADSLDRSHTQHIEIQRAYVKKDQLRIGVGDVVNVSVEELALQNKANLFEEIFGLEVVLESS